MKKPQNCNTGSVFILPAAREPGSPVLRKIPLPFGSDAA
jgi:hypothetical protein